MILIFQNRTPVPFSKKFLQAIFCVPGVAYKKRGANDKIELIR